MSGFSCPHFKFPRIAGSTQSRVYEPFTGKATHVNSKQLIDDHKPPRERSDSMLQVPRRSANGEMEAWNRIYPKARSRVIYAFRGAPLARRMRLVELRQWHGWRRRWVGGG